MQKMVVRLPFPLPTWNRVLVMNRWQRKKLRDLIHQFVSMCIPEGTDSLTQTEYQQRRRLMASFMGAYYGMIRPSTSGKCGTRRRKLVEMKRKKPYSR
jgi:hypothetical protein